MRGVFTVVMFFVFMIATMVVCNLGSIVLGLEHPSLPGWWLQLMSWATTTIGIVVAALATWLMRRSARTTPAPPPPPPPSFPPR